MNLIRKLAILVESSHDSLASSDIEIESYLPEEIFYHCVLMDEAGMIEATIAEECGDGEVGDALIFRLTWLGHDFLDAAKDDKLWNRVTKTIKERVTSVTFEGLMSLLKVSAQRVLTEGVDLLQ